MTSTAASEDVVEEINNVWKIVDKYNLYLRLKRLMQNRQEVVENDLPLDAAFLPISPKCVEDFLESLKDPIPGDLKGATLYLFWDSLRLYQLKVTFSTAKVYTATVALKIDDSDNENSDRTMKFAKLMNRINKGEIGALGQGINPGEAFKTAVNSLHAEFFGK